MYNGNGGVYFFNGNTVDVTATTNTGYATADGCEVWATTQDLA
ncbi:hypothetical protein SDC9_147849 [bioreactor metagenome]|uniref:Uncharacterized protein n=1 Tax=bioreactor metagenome TaxID=1076179 RepID=A0A645EJA3_9ZZZZ